MHSEKSQARCGLGKFGKSFWWRGCSYSLPASSCLCRDRKEVGGSKGMQVGRCREDFKQVGAMICSSGHRARRIRLLQNGRRTQGKRSQPWLGSFLAMQSWASLSTSLCLHFLLCQKEITISDHFEGHIKQCPRKSSGKS